MAGDMLRFATGGSMIKSEEDFVLSTEYERFILSQLYPLMPASEKFDELDLRDAEGAHHIIRATLDVGGGKAEVLKQSLAPLAFMSAWKIVDLFIELYLHPEFNQ